LAGHGYAAPLALEDRAVRQVVVAAEYRIAIGAVGEHPTDQFATESNGRRLGRHELAARVIEPRLAQRLAVALGALQCPLIELGAYEPDPAVSFVEQIAGQRMSRVLL